MKRSHEARVLREVLQVVHPGNVAGDSARVWLDDHQETWVGPKEVIQHGFETPALRNAHLWRSSVHGLRTGGELLSVCRLNEPKVRKPHGPTHPGLIDQGKVVFVPQSQNGTVSRVPSNVFCHLSLLKILRFFPPERNQRPTDA
jgi:hypothetical protein